MSVFNLQRLFTRYDRHHLTKRVIVFKTVLLYVFLLFVAVTVLAISILALPSYMTALTRCDEYLDAMVDIRHHSVKVFLLVCLFGPFLEEVSFRLWCSMKRWHVAVSFAGFVFSLLGGISNQGHYGIFMVVSLLVSAVLGYLFYTVVDQRALLAIRSNKRVFPVLVLISCIVFALFHVTNYDLKPEVLLYAAISTLPQFAGGVCLSYLRLNLGFFYGWFFHCLINGSGLLPLFLSNG